MSRKEPEGMGGDLIYWDRYILPLRPKLTQRHWLLLTWGSQGVAEKDRCSPEPPLATYALQVLNCLDLQPRLLLCFRGV